MVRGIVAGVDPKMTKAIDHLETDLGSLRTGRATTALVETVMVEQYGQLAPLRNVASLSTPDARTIAITPWDKALLQTIEKAIRETQSLGLTPNNDGSVIRLNIPTMTEERRREIVKQLGEKVEQCRVTLRNVRHEALSEIKKLEQSKQATQDDLKWAETELNKKIEAAQVKIEAISGAKQKEIMEV